MDFFSRNSFCLVTGASRGLGREIAVQLSEEWSKAGKGSIQVVAMAYPGPTPSPGAPIPWRLLTVHAMKA